MHASVPEKLHNGYNNWDVQLHVGAFSHSEKRYMHTQTYTRHEGITIKVSAE